MTNGEALARDAAYASSFGIAAMVSGSIYLISGQSGWLVALLVCLGAAVYFAVDYWRIDRRIEREVDEEMRRWNARNGR